MPTRDALHRSIEFTSQHSAGSDAFVGAHAAASGDFWCCGAEQRVIAAPLWCQLPAAIAGAADEAMGTTAAAAAADISEQEQEQRGVLQALVSVRDAALYAEVARVLDAAHALEAAIADAAAAKASAAEARDLAAATSAAFCGRQRPSTSGVLGAAAPSAALLEVTMAAVAAASSAAERMAKLAALPAVPPIGTSATSAGTEGKRTVAAAAAAAAAAATAAAAAAAPTTAAEKEAEAASAAATAAAAVAAAAAAPTTAAETEAEAASAAPPAKRRRPQRDDAAQRITERVPLYAGDVENLNPDEARAYAGAMHVTTRLMSNGAAFKAAIAAWFASNPACDPFLPG